MSIDRSSTGGCLSVGSLLVPAQAGSPSSVNLGVQPEEPSAKVLKVWASQIDSFQASSNNVSRGSLWGVRAPSLQQSPVIGTSSHALINALVIGGTRIVEADSQEAERVEGYRTYAKPVFINSLTDPRVISHFC
jgi:hypothetical protein